MNRWEMHQEKHQEERRRWYEIACKRVDDAERELFAANSNLAMLQTDLWWVSLCFILDSFPARGDRFGVSYTEGVTVYEFEEIHTGSSYAEVWAKEVNKKGKVLKTRIHLEFHLAEHLTAVPEAGKVS